MAKDPMANFEIPPEMRKLAEHSVEQARKAFDGFVTAAYQAVDALEGNTRSTRSSAGVVSEKAMIFAERNIAAAFDFAQKLMRARDVEEVAHLQAEYVRTQMEALTEQAKELGQSAKAAMDRASPQR